MGDATKTQRIALWRAGLLALFTAHMLWAAGIWLPGAEAGFVTTGQFRTLKDDVKRIETGQITAKIDLMQERACKAALERNHDARRYAAKSRDDHMREYFELKGANYAVPSCQELGYDVLRSATIPGQDDN